MNDKIKLIGIFYIILGAMGLLGLPMIYIQKQVIASLLTNLGSLGGEAQHWLDLIQEMLRILVPAMVLLIIVHVAVNVLVGICFIKHKAYRSCLIASVFTCLLFPLGTVLGVFALMVLIDEETKKKFGVQGSSSQ